MSASPFLSGYVLVLTLILVIGVIGFGIGAVFIFSGRSKIDKKNIFILFLYRLVQLYFVIQLIYLAVMLSVQLFSFRPYAVSHKTGAPYGLMWFADGYRVPVWTNYDIPKKTVSIVTNENNSTYTFSSRSNFSWSENIVTKMIDSMDGERMPVIDGAPYIRSDTVTNVVHVSYPVNRRAAIYDTSIAVVPPRHAYTSAFLHSSSHWKNFIFSLFTYINIFSRLVIAFFLLKILSSFRKEQLFTRKNFSYVSYIGITLMVYPVLNLVLALICNHWIIGGIFIDGVSNIEHYQANIRLGIMIRADFGWTLFLMGFLIVVFAQVFKRGFMLDQDQKLTI